MDVRSGSTVKSDMVDNPCKDPSYAGSWLPATSLAVPDAAVGKGVQLTGKQFPAARWEGADLRGIDLADADFSTGARADLAYADLEKADLANATFNNAILVGADFTGAKVTDAFFRNALLTDVDLSKTTGELPWEPKAAFGAVAACYEEAASRHH